MSGRESQGQPGAHASRSERSRLSRGLWDCPCLASMLKRQRGTGSGCSLGEADRRPSPGQLSDAVAMWRARLTTALNRAHHPHLPETRPGVLSGRASYHAWHICPRVGLLEVPGNEGIFPPPHSPPAASCPRAPSPQRPGASRQGKTITGWNVGTFAEFRPTVGGVMRKNLLADLPTAGRDAPAMPPAAPR